MTASGTQAIDRAAELLSRVVLAEQPPGFAELVTDSGLAKSTASRLLQALERHRLVCREDDGSYEAGPLFTLFAQRQEPTEELVQLAHTSLEQVSAATGETVNLAVARGQHVVQIAQVDSTYLLGTTNWVGVDVPPHTSALGKVFFAAGALPLPTSPLERRTPATITDPALFAAELDLIRRRGYAEARGELEVGLHAIAAPILDDQDCVVAALGLSGPSDRLSHRLPQLAELLKSHTQTLTRTLRARRPNRKEGAA